MEKENNQKGCKSFYILTLNKKKVKEKWLKDKIKVAELWIAVKDKRGYIVLSHMGWENSHGEGYYILKEEKTKEGTRSWKPGNPLRSYQKYQVMVGKCEDPYPTP